MKMKSVKESFRNFRQTMKGLSLEERIDHIWAYYKLELLLILLIPIVLYGLISWLCATPITTVFSGNLTNANITQAGYSYLTDGYLQQLGGNSEREKADLMLSDTAGTQIASANATGVDEGVRVAAMVAAGTLDYIMTDRVGLEYYATQGAFENIESVLTQEQLAPYADKLYFHTDAESGETIPVAINISDLPFAVDCLDLEKEIYLGFPIQAPHAQRLTQFFEYLLSWEK